MDKITKIELSNGQVYGIFDTGSIRLNKDPYTQQKLYPAAQDNVIVTGNSIVDAIIIDSGNGAGHGIYITRIDDQAADMAIGQGGYAKLILDETTGCYKIERIATEKVLEDINGTHHEAPQDGKLKLQIGN